MSQNSFVRTVKEIISFELFVHITPQKVLAGLLQEWPTMHIEHAVRWIVDVMEEEKYSPFMLISSSAEGVPAQKELV